MYEKFDKAAQNTPYQSLDKDTREFIRQKSALHKLTFSQIKNLITICVDLQMWGEDIKKLWIDSGDESLKQVLLAYENLKTSPKIYAPKCPEKNWEVRFEEVEKEGFGFGRCPVASDKTRCCNLLTLDVFEGCGFGCSYCAVQTFYQGVVRADKNFTDKLSKIKLEPQKLYHIGTGQSSDSLMFGNKMGNLSALFDFARKNPNVILEMKSKSGNIDFFLKNDVPKNIICTFSLNPQTVIDNEEHFTASLKERIEAAWKLSQKDILVGFHFHPMIFFDGFTEAYQNIADTLIERFDTDKVALVSMGTLTFTKPVLRQIRQKAAFSKILQMPLTQSGGKFSYPLGVKKQMFKALYDAFATWHKEVFFYLCMEDKSLWSEVFGYEYESNDALEEAMKTLYKHKIEKLEA